MDFVLANARSLETKIVSVYNLFEELTVSAVLICESWFKSGGNYLRIKEDIELNKGLKSHAYNRPGKRVGGGVCVISDPNKLKLEENKFTRKSYEIVSVKGQLIGMNKSIVIYVIYLPPNLSTKKVQEACLLVNDDVTRMKLKLTNPLILIAGDVNQFDISKCFADHSDFDVVTPLATRGESKIDLITCNFLDNIEGNEVLPPLRSAGSFSDHKALLVRYAISRRHNFSVRKFQTRKITEEGHQCSGHAATAKIRQLVLCVNV